MSKQFYRFVKNEAGNSELYLEGVIASESWYDDEVSPKTFREQLDKHSGDITVRINSPGGDVFAGLQIYNMLKDRSGDVNVIVDALAASAASFIAMAGDKITMNTGSMMMIHKASTIAWGNEDEMTQVIEQLRKVDDSIVSVYASRTGKSNEDIKELLAAETWMSAEDAVEMGFADEATAGKAKLSDTIKNLTSYTQEATAAAMQPVMSMKLKLDNKVENETPVEVPAVEETVEVVETPVEPVEPVTEPTQEPEEVVAEETPTETEVTNNNKETKMSKQDDAAIENIATVAPTQDVETPKVDMKAYLASPKAMEAFANILEANPAAGTAEDLAGTGANDSVRNAWKEHLEVTMGVTNPEIFLPTPLIQEIEDAFKEGGEIWAAVSKTGLDSFNAAWDANDDPSAESGRAKGYRRSVAEEKVEQTLTLANRILRPQFVYKYITLNREDVKEQRSTGALVRFVLSELPKRIVREIERAIVIGDGRGSGAAQKIQEGTPRGFFPVAADAVAGNAFASVYTGVEGSTVYETLRRARAEVKADGPVIMVAKEGLLLDMEFEQNANGGFLFAPGSDLNRYIKVDAVVEPDWMEDAAHDAYIFAAGYYRVVGDQSIEAFQNFILKTNKNEYLQEIWAGGGLTALKSGVAVVVPAES